MALVGVELKTLVSEPDALTTRPPQRALIPALYDSKLYVCNKCTFFDFTIIKDRYIVSSYSDETIFYLRYFHTKLYAIKYINNKNLLASCK